MNKNSLNPFKNLLRPEVTTSMLLALFSSYKDPRGRIHDFHKNGILTSVKQGVYLIHNDLVPCPYSKLLLANMIFGPSYISLETALSYYGFIPEKVESITSISFAQNKIFNTAVGIFTYHHISNKIYPYHVTLQNIDDNVSILMATPEKALLDFLYFREKKGTFSNEKDYVNYILNSYRLDLTTIQKTISFLKLKKLAKLYNKKHISWFVVELFRRLKK